MADASQTRGPAFLPSHLRFLFRVYVLGMVYFSIFRLVFILVDLPQARAIPARVFFQAWLMGWRFDTVVSGHILLLPLVLSTSVGFFAPRSVLWKRPILWLLLAAYLFSFALCTIDIPYYRTCNSRLTAALTTWMGDTQIFFNAVIHHSYYLLFLLLFIASATTFVILIRLLWKTWARNDQPADSPQPKPLRRALLAFISLAILFAGIRGRLSVKSPIRWGTAFFSNYTFANQMGLNPVFTFTASYLENRKTRAGQMVYMDDSSAIEHVRSWLHTTNGHNSPIARQIVRYGPEKKYNIVLIIMESMAKEIVDGRVPGTTSLTPYLDELKANSLVFDHFYSTGIHTYNAIWETFTSIPNFPVASSPLKDPKNMLPLSGMATVLSRHGYRTLFACPHDEQFDNMGGFLRINGFQAILSPKDFPGIHLTKPWDMPDHMLFDQVLPYIRSAGQSCTPFFFTILTVSNHPPFTLPDPFPPEFSPASKEEWKQAVEYADWSIRRFISQLQLEPWFDRTIFVLVADHGLNLNPRFEINPYAHHIPLIIHAPSILPQPRRFSQFGAQMDIFPTLMTLLNISYTNNTFGIDLFSENRPFITLCADSTLGVIDSRFLLILSKKNTLSLFAYASEQNSDYLRKYPALAADMKTHAFALLQTARRLLDRREAGLPDF